jgi:dihydrolipoamide dehydrogenase
MEKYTAIIMGGGPAGHSAAIRIAELGGRVALVERDYIGGICTNWGCTPSKSMIESAKVAKTVADSARYGVKVDHMHVDFPAVANRRNQVITSTREFITDLLKHHNVDIYQGEGEIVAPGKMLVRGGKLDPDGKTMHYTGEDMNLMADNIIISTGSQPLIPGFVDISDPAVVSSNRLISINELPKSLTIIGGGVIGLEFATIFSNLGSQVTIIEFLDRVLAQMDEDVSAEITRILEERGVKILTSHKCVSLKDGVIEAENVRTGEMVKIDAPMTLVAIGRMAVVHDKTYQDLGLNYTRKGVDVDGLSAHQRARYLGHWRRHRKVHSGPCRYPTGCHRG